MRNLKDAFPGAKFKDPAKEEDILEAERILGVLIPERLKELYSESDGFREDKGNAKYLLSVLDEDFIGSLVSITKHMWSEFPVPEFRNYIFFGSSVTDCIWGMNISKQSEVIAYHHSMEDEFEVVGGDVIDVYIQDYSIYEQIT
tara:strand:- start:674 stop:1105 length:432 start_codon:yes stop_codon:yes gene_type:complete